jgi:hypothetical protein
MRLALAAAVLLVTSSLAQTKPDFSGVFLRTQIATDKDHLHAAVPRILEITQTVDEVTVTAIQNGETVLARYSLSGKNSEKFQARLKGGSLVIKGTSQRQMLGDGIGMPPIPLEKQWTLSPDLQQLTIRTIGNLAVAESEMYTRQPSLEAAQSAARRTSRTSCNAAVPLSTLSKMRRLDRGAQVGVTGFEQITRCVLYKAVVSGDFFKGLERVESSGSVQFRKKDRSISTYAGDVVLEVEPDMRICPGEMGNWAQTGPEVPGTVEQLRFVVRWLGTDQRDLGEVPSEVLTEPMRETDPAEVSYRMRIPAGDVPLTDDLEVAIFAKTGEQLACIKGHI